jgi:hypothetical protein
MIILSQDLTSRAGLVHVNSETRFVIKDARLRRESDLESRGYIGP